MSAPKQPRKPSKSYSSAKPDQSSKYVGQHRRTAGNTERMSQAAKDQRKRDQN